MNDAPAPAIPHQSYASLFLRFLRFGLLAWGGPVAQIAMIRKELVDEERWISSERFNRALAVYQVLPGPEAHELCVYFGMLARGRPGAVLAGLGFMLPGFLLMFALSWVYLSFGIRSPLVATAFAAVQAAVIALIVRAVHRIGRGALTDRWLWVVALLSAIAQFFGVHFGITLVFAGFAYFFCARRRYALAVAVTLACAGAALAYVMHFDPTLAVKSEAPAALRTPGLLELFVSGLKAGLLTFGGAYTAIPFLRRDAVVTGAWMTDAQFLDGLALSGTLPAPLIIFATFVGYVGGGPWGAVLVTVGIFLPAFGFTLIGHDFFERVTRNEPVHKVLDGVTAGVVGLIATAAIVLFREGIRTAPAVGIFAAAIMALYLWRSKWAVLAVVLGSAAVGLLVDVRN